MPKSAAKATAELQTYPVKVSGLSAVPARTSPQLIVFLDLLDNIHAEAAGQNGQRRKIDLPPDFRDRNPELFTALCEARDLSRRIEAPLPSAGDLAKRRDDEIAARNAEQARLVEQKRRDHWNSLTEDQQAAILAAKEAAKEKQRARELETAHSVWNRTAQTVGLGVNLANRVIDDPARRPRSAKTLTRLINGEPAPRRNRKIDLDLAVEGIEL